MDEEVQDGGMKDAGPGSIKSMSTKSDAMKLPYPDHQTRFHGIFSCRQGLLVFVLSSKDLVRKWK